MRSPEFADQLNAYPPTGVLVVGAGPSGLSAALSAARNGAQVRVVERFGFVGGNLTAGLVGPCMTSFSLDGRTQLVRGIFDEFVRRMEAEGGAVHPSRVRSGTDFAGFMGFGHERVTPFDPESAKAVALEMLQEAGVELLLHTFVADVVTDGRRIRGVVVANKDGLGYLPADVVVDCTGDGDVAARAGAEVAYGRDGDGAVQPMTLFFRVRNVDDRAVEEYARAHPEDLFPFQSIVERARAEGRFPIPRRGIQLFRTPEPGVWRINTTRVLGRDGTSAADLTAAEIEARGQVRALLEFFRTDVPGLERAELLDTAATIGVRETRRVVGEYTLTLEDLIAGRHFDDVVAVAGYPVDIHSPVSGDGPFDDGIPATANVYEIPFRSLVPRDLDNVLVSGRCLSATHEALAAVRVMPPCFAMGEAAGLAAAWARQDGTTVHDVDVTRLQRRLVEQGAYLGDRLDPALAAGAAAGRGA
ncbi:fumarate reductase/succinate dehydrogenase flavoprotein domain protein [Beutenbergia cavernae DSM 12333]|uniref:Fumarate reductase/succinate dehydrogenase flavoprotein domain protein n=1 Tax=Beutenbergia cavernae (strain ATCC BAA-8 / DSM 12333 / CCUG 43141 / JCM 11478 / NBRC 16432 / NCIMB 13614 / HKI 0122) TaxID=471853 RepID=C5C4Z5_BEUC1|nr:FAD-dependent oxidoreductase [Beutenbergia cavernae]ACQ80123.1 fumarate reductase/succinate dehydrogenase flavoprotein domain protein [Beutenbergia cavernae DSM 12333]